MTKYPECRLEIELENGQPVMFCRFGGRRIAKRYPDTSKSKKWIALEPGFAVYERGNKITVQPVDVAVQ